MKIVVEAFWDDEAAVWVASDRDQRGVVTEAETIEELQKKLALIVPDLMADTDSGPIEIELITRSFQTVAA
ncbi:DUF1902 domain-containing protein [Oryzicola mucosus]|uniref:DUF1902 domain-containing protein n=1 Tax=Oryzicola mucosus TaxID=2767425 RepID=A0A8J6U1A7_9HYPH|nr:DUF1902 domain-containing protein [Oryzicola mucosus]MBD0414208.1 DUF1902 domain-containing protein [Oryzicola mucosus]